MSIGIWIGNNFSSEIWRHCLFVNHFSFVVNEVMRSFGHFVVIIFLFFFLSMLIPPCHRALKCQGLISCDSISNIVSSAQWDLSIWRLMPWNSEKVSSIISSLFFYLSSLKKNYLDVGPPRLISYTSFAILLYFLEELCHFIFHAFYCIYYFFHYIFNF